MKIILMRHAEPDFRPEKQYTSEDYNEAQKAYREAGVCADLRETAETFEGRAYAVYSAPDRCCLETAEAVFPGRKIRKLDELSEIPYRAAFETIQPVPVWVWDRLAQYQCKRGIAVQEESERQAAGRAQELLKRLEKEGQDCILVTHSRFMKILMRVLRSRGYAVTRGSYGRIGYLERIRAAQRREHCGACNRNCLLSHPGCAVGQDKLNRLKNKAV